MRLNRLTLHFAAVLLLTQAASVSAANINVVWTSEVGQFAPLWVTKEAKLFEKYGNSVQLIFIQGASSAAAALSSGDAQVGMFSPQVVISTPALDLVMFGRLGNTMDNRIFARKGIKSIKEVKRIAISRFGSNADFAARYLLQREGLKPDIDVALLQVGNQSNRIVAVETNNADAAMLTPPMTLQAQKLGMTLLHRRVEARNSLLQLILCIAPALPGEESRRPRQLYQSDDRGRLRVQVQQRVRHEGPGQIYETPRP